MRVNERNYVILNKVAGGYSADEIFCVADEFNNKYLLRKIANKNYNIETFFPIWENLYSNNIPIIAPIDYEIRPDGIYLIQEWAYGETLRNLLVGQPDIKQHFYGVKAGRIGRIFHSYIPKKTYSWEESYNQKIDRILKRYSECSEKFSNDEYCIEYIQKNRHLLRERPLALCHGDYHDGNIMMGVAERLYVIDFGSFHFADPWSEFDRLNFSAQTSPKFAAGMVQGYFDGEPPILFWQIVALYVAANALSAMYWALPRGQEQVDYFRVLNQRILEWYNDFNDIIPNWYFE